MKIKRIINIVISAFLFGFAVITISTAKAETFPSFPMAFWGSVTVDGVSSSVGTVVRAYYGTTLAGQIVVQELGIYGYTETIKQKLLIAEGAGQITFKFQQNSLNGGAETDGTTLQTYATFESGITKNFNLAFTLPVPPTPSQPPTQTTSGGGGGGGGGGGYYTPVTPPAVAASAAPQGQVLGATVFSFTSSLKIGSRGNDVTELQKRLTQEGLYSGPITGYFGLLTQAGVKAYQLKYGISNTGFVGPLTRAQLNAGQVAGVSIANTEAIRAQIAGLQAQLVILLQKLAAILQAQITH